MNDFWKKNRIIKCCILFLLLANSFIIFAQNSHESKKEKKIKINSIAAIIKLMGSDYNEFASCYKQKIKCDRGENKITTLFRSKGIDFPVTISLKTSCDLISYAKITYYDHNLYDEIERAKKITFIPYFS